MIIGIDVGYTYTKVFAENYMDIFKSTIREEELDAIASEIVIEKDNKRYVVGERGGISVEQDKISDKVFEMCLYAGVARAMDSESDVIDLVTGLPISYYKSQKDRLKEKLQDKEISLKLNGCKKHFRIRNVLVFPQSAGFAIIEPQSFIGDTLIIDIGGMTVDVSYFEETDLSQYRTYPLGMLKLYGKIIDHVNSVYALNFDNPFDAEKIIKNGLYIDDKKVDFELNSILKEHTEEILSKIKLEFPYRTSKKIFIGGGALVLKQHLPSNDIFERNIFANAEAFYRIGVSYFG